MNSRTFFILGVFFAFLGNLLFAQCSYLDQPEDDVSSPTVPCNESFLHSVNVPNFRAKIAKLVPSWMVENVQNGLAPFNKIPISQKALQATLERTNSHGSPVSTYLWRYRIVGKRVYRYQYGHEGFTGDNGMDQIVSALVSLTDSSDVPDLPTVDFLINLLEGMPIPWDPPKYWITEDERDQAPILCAWKRENTPYVITIPSRGTLACWGDIVGEVLAGNAQYPWHNKIQAACWRGSVSDIYVPLYYVGDDSALIEDYSHRPRYLLCYLSYLYPWLIDAGLLINDVPSQALVDFLQPLAKPFLSRIEHLRHTYLPFIDGYGDMGSGWGGYEWRLLSNSVVFKQESSCSTWFEGALAPYVHYIPIHNNVDDLIDRIRWAQTHAIECQQIANTATQFVLDNLMTEDFYLYFYYLFQEYSKYQTFDTEELLSDSDQNPSWIRIR